MHVEIGISKDTGERTFEIKTDLGDEVRCFVFQPGEVSIEALVQLVRSAAMGVGFTPSTVMEAFPTEAEIAKIYEDAGNNAARAAEDMIQSAGEGKQEISRRASALEGKVRWLQEENYRLKKELVGEQRKGNGVQIAAMQKKLAKQREDINRLKDKLVDANACALEYQRLAGTDYGFVKKNVDTANNRAHKAYDSVYNLIKQLETQGSYPVELLVALHGIATDLMFVKARVLSLHKHLNDR